MVACGGMETWRWIARQMDTLLSRRNEVVIEIKEIKRESRVFI